jgi:hypothetical protein
VRTGALIDRTAFANLAGANQPLLYLNYLLPSLLYNVSNPTQEQSTLFTIWIPGIHGC